MQHCPVQSDRLLIIAFLALVQLFAPLVHAHTGDSRQAGMHVHTPGAAPRHATPMLSADPGMEIGIEVMRREKSGVITPGPDIPPLPVALSAAPTFVSAGAPAVAPPFHPGGNPGPGANPPRGPPADSLR